MYGKLYILGHRLSRFSHPELRPCNSVDPSHFGDPVALQTPWSATTVGGASHTSHKLVRITPSRMELHASVEMKLVVFIFLLLTLVPTLFAMRDLLTAYLMEAHLEMTFAVLGGLICVPLVLVGLFFEAALRSPAVFDKSKDYFSRGKSSPAPLDPEHARKTCKISQVHALQLICIRNTHKLDPKVFDSYELNLVLRDGGRVNVFNHGNLEHARAKARMLAGFLAKPLWDAV